jgi:tRNA (pseudouridine54-N1)-methyltransferase
MRTAVKRRFVVIGQTATASPDFLLDDLPGSSGRLDVLLRCVRAALLVSHGVRRDAAIYLVLGGGPRAPRTVKIDGATAEYLRQDERSLAGTLKKMLAYVEDTDAFDAPTRGIAIARGGLDVVLADLGAFTPYVLDESGADVRTATLDVENPVFFVGDHMGFAADARARIDAAGASPISVGPISLHADDAIAIIGNELDRRTMR